MEMEASTRQKCPYCGVTRKERTEGFSKHLNLCLGINDEGKALHNHCLICGQDFSQKSEQALFSHYRRHNQDINRDHTIRDIHREFCPQDYPDFNFNNNYGLSFTRQNVVGPDTNEKITHYWKIFSQNPSMISYSVRDIRDDYREAFFDFFNVDPISLHGHSPRSVNASWEEPTASTRFAVVEGSYGFGFGPLAYDAQYSSVACGEQPFCVDLSTKRPDLSIKRAKAQGCVALLASIVRSTDGSVMTPQEWKTIVDACRKQHLVLVVDEAMTAIRCGAPFAHQLSDYQRHGRPDLIIFGKGIKTNGVAIDWQGVNFQQMNFVTLDDRIDVINEWQKRFTETSPPENLLQSWGTIELARKQDWPGRAILIGATLRSILDSYQFQSSSVAGLHALIWIRRENNDQAIKDMAVVSASAGHLYTRWLPLMDTAMTSQAEVKTKVFGLGSVPYRKALAAFFVQKGWWIGECCLCGEAMETGEPGEHVCLVVCIF